MGAAHTIHTQCQQYYLLLLYTSTIPYILHYLLSIYCCDIHSTTQQTTNAQSTYIITTYQILYSFIFTIPSDLVVTIMKLTPLRYYYQQQAVESSKKIKSLKTSPNQHVLIVKDIHTCPLHPYCPLWVVLHHLHILHWVLAHNIQVTFCFATINESFYNSFKLDNKNMSKGQYTRVEQQTATQPFILYMQEIDQVLCSCMHILVTSLISRNPIWGNRYNLTYQALPYTTNVISCHDVKKRH